MFLRICAKSKKAAKEQLKERNEHGNFHYSLTKIKLMKQPFSACKSHGLKTYKTHGKYRPKKDDRE